MNRIASGLIGLILIYGVGNAVLVGAQNLFSSGDQNKLNNLQQELQTKKTSISVLGYRIDAEKSNMDQEKANGDSVDYNAQVDDYNSKLAEYQSNIDDYNNTVQQANDLSKKIGGTWYIVPIPFGHGE